MVASPLSSASCFTSSTRTGMTALAKHMAMPPPMVPAPITAAERMARVGVSSGTSGIFAAARSARNACLSAFDSGELTSSMKSCRSIATPSSNGLIDAALAKDRERPLRGHAAGERDGAGEQVAFDHFVEEVRLRQLLRWHRGSGDDQVERRLQADGPGKPLRAAGAGKKAELHLRQ